MQSLDNRATSLLANLSSVLGRLTADRKRFGGDT
jgi:hypothetical protein